MGSPFPFDFPLRRQYGNSMILLSVNKLQMKGRAMSEQSVPSTVIRRFNFINSAAIGAIITSSCPEDSQNFLLQKINEPKNVLRKLYAEELFNLVAFHFAAPEKFYRNQSCKMSRWRHTIIVSIWY